MGAMLQPLKIKMKKIVFYLLATIFAIAALFTSCKKDEDKNEKVQLVKSMTCYWGGEKDLLTINFEYDKKNRITNVTTDSLGAIDNRFLYQFEYNGNDLVKLIVGYHNPGLDFPYLRIFNFSKNENKITVLNNGFNCGEIELNRDGFPITASQSFIRNTDSIVNSYTYQYLDGNLVSVSHVGFINDNLVSNHIKTLKHENTKSPFYNCIIPQWTIFIDEITFPSFIQSLIQRYNISEYKYWRSFEGEEYEQNIKYTYEYDNNGFATKMYIDGKLWNTYTY